MAQPGYVSVETEEDLAAVLAGPNGSTNNWAEMAADLAYTKEEERFDFLLDGDQTDPKFAGVASARMAARRDPGGGFEFKKRDKAAMNEINKAAFRAMQEAKDKKRALLAQPPPEGAMGDDVPIEEVQREMEARIAQGRAGPLMLMKQPSRWDDLNIPEEHRRGTDGWNLSLETHPGWQGWLVVLIPQAEVNMAHHVKYAHWPK
jgi:hypothetical protein